MFHILAQVTCDQCLTNHCVPCFILFPHTGAEDFEVFMQMRLYFGSFFTL